MSPSKFIKADKSVVSSKDLINIGSASYLKVEGNIESMSIKEPFKASNTFVSIDEIEPIIRYAQTFADRDLS